MTHTHCKVDDRSGFVCCLADTFDATSPDTGPHSCHLSYCTLTSVDVFKTSCTISIGVEFSFPPFFLCVPAISGHPLSSLLIAYSTRGHADASYRAAACIPLPILRDIPFFAYFFKISLFIELTGASHLRATPYNIPFSMREQRGQAYARRPGQPEVNGN